MSEFNETLYRTYVSPWVRAMATPWTAEMLKWSHPMRSSRYLLSESFNPWMRGVAALAESLTTHRQALSHDNPLIEREAFGEVTKALKKVREARDSGYERAFDLLFAQPEAFAKLIHGMGGTMGQQPKT